MIIALVLGAVVAFVIYVISLILKRRNLPPGPWGLPFVGYLPFMAKNGPESFMKLAEHYGPVLTVRIGSRDWVVLDDVDSINEGFVKRSDDFSGRPYFFLFSRSTPHQGILFSEYTKGFIKQRKFDHDSLRSLKNNNGESTITTEFEHMLQAINFQDGAAFDPQVVLLNASCNILSKMFLGVRFSYDDTIFKEMIRILNSGFLDKKHSQYITLLTFMPGLRHFPPFSSTYKRFRGDRKSFTAIIKEKVLERKHSVGEEEGTDFISLYLKEMEANKEVDQSFHEMQLVYTVQDFFVGGTGTIAGILRWCLLRFAHYPDEQQRVCDEIETVVGEKAPSMQHKENMAYTNAFIAEITRHRTPVPLGVMRAPIRGIKFRGYSLPKGIPVIPNIWAAHHDPKYFNDPESFVPDRFLNSDGSFMKSHRALPFSVGSRRCIGEDLAKMSIFLLLVNILQKFKIEKVSEKNLPDFNDGLVGNAHVPRPFEVKFISR